MKIYTTYFITTFFLNYILDYQTESINSPFKKQKLMMIYDSNSLDDEIIQDFSLEEENLKTKRKLNNL